MLSVGGIGPVKSVLSTSTHPTSPVTAAFAVGIEAICAMMPAASPSKLPDLSKVVIVFPLAAPNELHALFMTTDAIP